MSDTCPWCGAEWNFTHRECVKSANERCLALEHEAVVRDKRIAELEDQLAAARELLRTVCDAVECDERRFTKTGNAGIWVSRNWYTKAQEVMVLHDS